MATVSDNIIKIQVNDGIRNPSSAISSLLTLNIYDSSSLLKDYNTGLLVAFTPGNLDNVNISSSSQNCGELANYKITFKANQPIIRGGYIRINLPSFPQNSGINSSQYLIKPNTSINVSNV
jgi:hypothetical protein